jgi:serine/threonine protein kinase
MTNALPLRQIGRYEILEKVGSGGLGEVYKARNIDTGEIVALKRLHDRYQHSKRLLGLFHKEIMIHSRVDHRHCVNFIEAHLKPPHAHIVTGFVDGANIHNLIRHTGAIPPLVASCILIDALQGLEHLHCLDVVHSDITPSNIMVDKTGKVLLADFGLSCINEIEDYAGITVGTPGYQAPERLLNQPITAQSDIYCAGIVFHEMLTGGRLFASQDQKITLQHMRRLNFDWIRTGDKYIDKGLKYILGKSLEYRPTKRYETPKDFMFSLYQILKAYKIRYTRRAILQWLQDRQLTSVQTDMGRQPIYVRPPQ